jgi:predicted transcriptional regulator
MTRLRVVGGRESGGGTAPAGVVVEGCGLARKGMRLSYESWDLVLHVVTPERLALIRTVRSRQPVNAYHLALMIGRDPEEVLVDVRLLLDAHLLGGTEHRLHVEYERLSFSLDL